MRGGGLQTLVSTGFFWGGGTMHFKVMMGWGLAPAATPVPTHMDCISAVYFNSEGGKFYLFYRASQFYDLRSFLPFNWKKTKNCVMLD